MDINQNVFHIKSVSTNSKVPNKTWPNVKSFTPTLCNFFSYFIFSPPETMVVNVSTLLSLVLHFNTLCLCSPQVGGGPLT